MSAEKQTQCQSLSLTALPNALFMKVCRKFSSRKVTVEKSTAAEKQNYYKYEQVGPSGMSLMTENFLRGNLFHELLDKDPSIILKAILDFYKVAQDAVYFLIAADVCRYYARKKTGDECARAHFSALYYGFLSLQTQQKQNIDVTKSTENFFFQQELQIYNEAIAGLFIHLKKNNLLDSHSFSLYGLDGMEFRMEKPEFRLSVPRSAVSDFTLCSDYSVKTLRLINRHSGIGVPLVARVTDPHLSVSLQTPPGLCIPVTVTFRFQQVSDHLMSVYPIYSDTFMKEKIHPVRGLVHDDMILSRDFTTPLACFMNAITQRNLLSGMLHPVKYDAFAGLYMVEPYRPEKIPVIFIHGLMSSPETWGQMINSLRYDPKIRRKYQFWFFSYSTGTPVLYSAKKLERALLSAQKEFCTTPDATANFEKMVLIGHSMGGLVARVLMQKNPYRLFEYLTHLSWPELCEKLKPEILERLKSACIIEPLPFVRRVLFMAVPHRGADMAKRGLARLGINLIRMPQEMIRESIALFEALKPLIRESNLSWRKDSFITGIDNLNPDGVFIRWLKDSLLKDGLVFHSIIANKAASDVPGGSDGIVPYFSSHLDGAASECIVKSGHNVHCTPPAILEVMRILLVHLKEVESAEQDGSGQ